MAALVTDYDIEYDGVLISTGDASSSYSLIEGDIFTGEVMRSSDLPRGQQDGEFAGVDLLAGRDITLRIEVDGTSPTTLRTAYLALLTALRKRDSEKLLRLKLPGWPDLRVSARPRRKAGVKVDVPFSMGTLTQLDVQFHCTDPRFYADAANTGQAGISTSTAGMTFDVTFDLSFGGVGTSNTINAVNSGNYDAPWQAVITGPITNPAIEHVEQAKILRFVGTVPAGETLVVTSPPGGAVLLNGTASRYSWLQDASQWFLLQPGNNSVRFTGSTVGTPTLDLTWRSAWVL